MQTILSRRTMLLGGSATLATATGGVPAQAQPLPGAAEIRAIAKEA